MAARCARSRPISTGRTYVDVFDIVERVGGCVGNAVEHGHHVAAERVEGNDQRSTDETRNETVFDRSRAVFMARKHRAVMQKPASPHHPSEQIAEWRDQRFDRPAAWRSLQRPAGAPPGHVRWACGTSPLCRRTRKVASEDERFRKRWDAKVNGARHAVLGENTEFFSIPYERLRRLASSRSSRPGTPGPASCLPSALRVGTRRSASTGAQATTSLILIAGPSPAPAR